MAEEHTSKVNLPGTILRKPVKPGPNSWAQHQQHHINHQQTGGKVNKSDKYENKPMPPPPPESPSPNTHLRPRAYIQPAVPLLNPVPATKTPKDRAVTDPIVPKPLFGSRKVSVTELRKKYSNSKSNAKTKIDEPEVTRQSTPKPQVSSGEAAPPTSSVPVPATSVIDLFRNTYETPLEERDGPARQDQSTPVPTRRYLRENGLPTPKLIETPDATGKQADSPTRNGVVQPVNLAEYTQTAGILHPPRLGTYANTGGIGRVEGHGMHRVESVVGVIENAGSGTSDGKTTCTTPSDVPCQSIRAQVPITGELYPPSLYTPSNYGGVWENDPAVGYSLPPFSPMPRDQLPTSNSSRSGLLFGNPQGLGYEPFKDMNPNLDRFSEYQHSFPSANSWASESQADSFASNNRPMSALPPPRWPHHRSINSVPSPPPSQQDFQRAGSVSAALTQIELTVHHHIDTAFGSLSRLITDKNDRVIDQTVRRLENLEDMVSRGFRSVKAEIKDVRKDVSRLHGGLNDVVKNSDRLTELVKGLEGKLSTLQGLLEQHHCQYERNVADQSTSEVESERQQRTLSHRRTESAHGALGQGEQRQQYQSGASGSSSSARQSETSSRRYRSNTLGSQSAVGTGDERNTHRDYHAEFGAARGPAPDLKDHPAFAGAQQRQNQIHQHSHTDLPTDLDGLSSQNPSLSDGRWYLEAYGQKH